MNIYSHNDYSEASYVPRESVDQCQARLQGTNGNLERGLPDQIVSATHADPRGSR